MTSYIDKFRSVPKQAQLLQQEKLILQVTDLICEVMNGQHCSRTRLAEKMNLTKGRISQILDGESNLTLRTIADIFGALGESVSLKLNSTERVQMIEGSKYYGANSNIWKVVTNDSSELLARLENEPNQQSLAS